MKTFVSQSVGLVAGALMLPLFASAAYAAPIPAGNLFYQNGAPVNGFESVAINNPQNMSGGQWAGGSTSNYPIGGASPVLDGDPSTAWNSGTTSGGGMLNVGMTQGYYSSDASSFTNIAFGEIATIRIYAVEQPNNDYVAFPQQVSVGYTTASFNPGNGYNYNSGTTGVIPGTWNKIATISAVNGVTPSAPTDSTDYSTANGWVASSFTNYVSGDQLGNDAQTDYMDLTLDIPAGATSVLVSFGADNSSTGNGGGTFIADIQAYAPVATPEPASLGLLSLGAVGLLARRRR